MLQFILKRLGLALLVAFTVSFISFSLLFLSGDPAAALAGETASGEDIEALRRLYGFDRPMLVQYGEWLFSARLLRPLWERCSRPDAISRLAAP